MKDIADRRREGILGKDKMENACDKCVKNCKCTHCVSECEALINMDIELSEDEKKAIDCFTIIPFIPVSKDETGQPYYLSDGSWEILENSVVLKSLEKKGMIKIDYDIPISNFDYEKYGVATKGSAALTALGQDYSDII